MVVTAQIVRCAEAMEPGKLSVRLMSSTWLFVFAGGVSFPVTEKVRLLCKLMKSALLCKLCAQT